MNRQHPPCAMCARFTIAGHDEAAARGEGWCSAWEAYKPWNGQIGVLFMPVKDDRDERRRRAWVEQQQQSTSA